ncbi:hypothetical protein AB0H12_13815 [Actinosynnema sp. NPDC023794]
MFTYRDYWVGMHRPSGMKRPLDCLDEVAAALGVPDPPAAAVAWDDVRQRLGIGLPGDYRRFVDRYGAGRAGALRVFAPGASTPSFDLFRQLERVSEETTEFRASTTPTFPGPYHPQEGGLIAWGEMDGLHFFWNPVGDDPDAWPVMISDPSWLMTFKPNKSFSRFLADHLAGKNAGSGAPLLSPEEGVGVRFVPAL